MLVLILVLQVRGSAAHLQNKNGKLGLDKPLVLYRIHHTLNPPLLQCLKQQICLRLLAKGP